MNRKSADTAVPLNPVKLRRYFSELQAVRNELEKRNQELTRIRSELDASGEMFRELYDFSPVGYLSLDRQGVIRKINRAGAGLFGMDRCLLLNRHFAPFVAGMSQPAFELLLARVFENKEKCACELTLQTEENRHTVVMIEAMLSRDQKECHAVLQDITEQKKMEEALRESEKKYRTIFENTGTPMAIVDENTIVHEINSEFEHLFGYSGKELVGGSWTTYVRKEDLEWLTEYRKRRMTDPEAVPRNYELKVVCKSGEIRDVYVTVALMPGSGKAVASFLDITPLKEAEKVLRENEALYHNLFENAPIGMFQCTFEEGRFLRVNRAYAGMLGYDSPEDMMSHVANVAELHVNPEDRAVLLENLRRQDWHYGEHPRFRKDGSIMIGKVAIRRVLKPDGTIDYIEGIVEDVTEQRRAERELKKYVEETRDLYENAPCGYHSLGEDGTILRMNDTELSWLGYSRDEVIGKMKFTDLLPPEEVPVFQNMFPVLKKLGCLRDIEGRLVRKNGEILPVIINATVLFDENGTYRISRASVFDNTERMAAENALAESESLYRSLFENASIGMFQTTLEGRFLRINKAYAAMLGYETPEEVISTITDTSTQIHADPGNRARLLAALEREDWFYAEQPYFRKDGSIMIGKAAIRKVVRQDGTIAYLEGIVEDVTEQKRTEEALRKGERELRIKAKNLMEVNTTLKVLLQTMEKDQEELKERIVANIREQIFPYLEKLKKTALDDVQKGFVRMAETGLDEIASPFVQKLTSRYFNLTKKELQIAALVKEGKTSKEIAALLNSKQRVIEFHRENIRAKLGLKNKKGNLSVLLRRFS